MRFATLILLVMVTSVMASYSRFPEDPPGVDVIDRAFFREIVDGEEYVVYLIMYNQNDLGTLDVISGTLSSGSYLWETVFSWKPLGILSEPVRFDPGSVIDMQLSGSSLIITWLDKFNSTYVEGAASLYLEYDLQSGSAEEVWSD